MLCTLSKKRRIEEREEKEIAEENKSQYTYQMPCKNPCSVLQRYTSITAATTDDVLTCVPLDRLPVSVCMYTSLLMCKLNDLVMIKNKTSTMR